MRSSVGVIGVAMLACCSQSQPTGVYLQLVGGGSTTVDELEVVRAEYRSIPGQRGFSGFATPATVDYYLEIGAPASVQVTGSVPFDGKYRILVEPGASSAPSAMLVIGLLAGHPAAIGTVLDTDGQPELIDPDSSSGGLYDVGMQVVTPSTPSCGSASPATTTSVQEFRCGIVSSATSTALEDRGRAPVQTCAPLPTSGYIWAVAGSGAAAAVETRLVLSGAFGSDGASEDGTARGADLDCDQLEADEDCSDVNSAVKNIVLDSGAFPCDGINHSCNEPTVFVEPSCDSNVVTPQSSCSGPSSNVTVGICYQGSGSGSQACQPACEDGTSIECDVPVDGNGQFCLPASDIAHLDVQQPGDWLTYVGSAVGQPSVTVLLSTASQGSAHAAPSIVLDADPFDLYFSSSMAALPLVRKLGDLVVTDLGAPGSGRAISLSIVASDASGGAGGTGGNGCPDPTSEGSGLCRFVDAGAAD